MKALDLFCGGAGGWSLGLHRAGIQTVAACEIDDWRRNAFSCNFPGTRMYADVRELSAAVLLRDLGYLPDIVVGSPPCQEISAANSKGEGITDDHLFWDWTRLVLDVRPRWCAAENSPRSRTAGIDGIVDALEQAGYAVWPLVVGTDNAGANHRRKRLWLIAADAERLYGETGRPLRRQAREGGPDLGRPAARDAADAERGELRFQQQRLSGGWPRGVCDEGEAVAGGDDPDAHGRLQGEPGRHADGCLDMGAGTNGHASDADSEGEYGQPGDGEMAGSVDRDIGDADAGRNGDAPDPSGARHPLGSRLGRDDGEELPPALRDIGCSWPDWNGGLAGLAAACAAAGAGGMDDGLPAGLAPGLRNRCLAAYGDAVVPEITEAIARSMTELMGRFQ